MKVFSSEASSLNMVTDSLKKLFQWIIITRQIVWGKYSSGTNSIDKATGCLVKILKLSKFSLYGDSLSDKIKLFVYFGLNCQSKRLPKKEWKNKTYTITVLWRLEALERQHERQQSSTNTSCDTKPLTTKAQYHIHLSKHFYINLTG